MKTFTATVAVASSLLLSASAQSQYSIDPTSVTNATKSYWCQQQMSQCPLICLQTAGNSAETETNNCDPATLTYGCVCSNGASPNISEYSQTLPYFICSEWGNQCVSNCAQGDSACQSSCRDNHPCGAQNPTRVNTSTIISHSSTKSASPMSSGDAASTDSSGATVYSGFGGAAASTSSGSGNADNSKNAAAGINVHAAVLNAGRTFGVLGVFGMLFGGFAVLL